jgi:hypothetical protein
MMVNYPQEISGGQPTMPMDMKMHNPTLAENIDAKIQRCRDEIERLEKIKAAVPQLLEVNLRDLQMAMQW